MVYKNIIAMDGPAGAGKSTVAKLVAKELNYLYLDTGAMYRAVTLKCLREGIDINSEDEVTKIITDIDIRFSENNNILLDGEDVSKEIRTIPVTSNVSTISSFKSVRTKMTEIQRKIGSGGEVVMEGRDIGTVVFPDAKYKFYIDASIEERARRRMKDLDSGSIDYNRLLNEIKTRDILDSTREIAPLKQAEDSIYIDTSGMNIEEVIKCIKEKIHSK